MIKPHHHPPLPPNICIKHKNTTPTTKTYQASLDHLCAVRFLLRARAKRRLKEEIAAEKKKAADLQTARVFAARLGRQQQRTSPNGSGKPVTRPMIGAERMPREMRESASLNRNSASES